MICFEYGGGFWARNKVRHETITLVRAITGRVKQNNCHCTAKYFKLKTVKNPA